MLVRDANGTVYDTTQGALPPGQYTVVDNSCCAPGQGPTQLPETARVVRSRPICEFPKGEPMVVNIAVCALPRMFVACDGSVVYKNPWGDVMRCPGGSTDSWEEADLDACPDVTPLKIDPETYNLYYMNECNQWMMSTYNNKYGYGAWANSNCPPCKLRDVYYDPKKDVIVFHKDLCEADARVTIDNPFCVGGPT